MVRKYTPKRRPWADKDKRMRRAVELRAAGLSLREIGKRLVVDEKTVRNDLARWERDFANVAPLRNSAAESRPAEGHFSAPEIRTATVTPLRRTS